MGYDVRYVPTEAIGQLPDRLREAGFELDIVVAVHKPGYPELPEVEVTRVVCRRGKDSQFIFWENNECEWKARRGEPGLVEVGIANATGWRRSVADRRRQLQVDVTAAIEAIGGVPLA